ncbi:hypothetical protein C1N62_13545 [Nissabacter sp. SGAir0207]|nr:hypothetical protein C1N62_13545 [Nissabacter sp. SGAir0207]
MDLHVAHHADERQRLQGWSLFYWVLHLHEKRCTKRAGVAGIALRAGGANMFAPGCVCGALCALLRVFDAGVSLEEMSLTRADCGPIKNRPRGPVQSLFVVCQLIGLEGDHLLPQPAI